MRKVLILVALVATVGIKARVAEVECENLSDDFFEDTLTISEDRSSVRYFDNDTSSEIPCVGLKKMILCANSRWTVRIDSKGEGTVWEGTSVNANTIKFNCQ